MGELRCCSARESSRRASNLTGPDVTTWREALSGRALFQRALGVHEVSHLQSQASPCGYLFGTQFAADSEFDLNSHSHLRRLRGCEVVDSLVDRTFIDRFGVERLGERELSFAKSPVGRLTFSLVLLEDHADALSLFGRQAKLIDRIFNCRRCAVLRVGGADRREEQERSE